MLHAVLPLPVPASVYGLVLLLAALTTGIVKLEQVKETGTYLTGIFRCCSCPPLRASWSCGQRWDSCCCPS